jgi:hypothetical protein
MLWYKEWLETRSRFLIALFGCVLLCLITTVEYRADLAPASRGEAGQLTLVHGVHMALAMAWILSVNLLMMGGLRQEKAGAASFTLALPVSRSRLLAVRFAMGFIEGAALVILPWIGMLFAAGIAGRSIAIYQACLHSLLLLAGGVFFLALAFLISSLIDSQYTAPFISIGLSVLLVYCLRDDRFSDYNPLTFMLGGKAFQWSTGLLSGHSPVLNALTFCVLAAVLIAISIKAIGNLDF